MSSTISAVNTLTDSPDVINKKKTAFAIRQLWNNHLGT
jgi:hypothetical protein